jgi:hypothetical protein
LQTRIAALAEQLDALANVSIPVVEGVVEGAAAEAEALSAEIMSLNTERRRFSGNDRPNLSSRRRPHSGSPSSRKTFRRTRTR